MSLGLRIGIGSDVHGFEENRPLMIGGIEVPHAKGLAGHSDADVLLHAVVDALLGAAGLGDIGMHFPSSDPRWKNKPSSEFLLWTCERLRQDGFKILSVDSVIIAQEPVMRPHIPQMEASLRALIRDPEAHIHVKATTTDHLGFVGRREGIACQAVALLSRGA
jgi:2-C-methyl-D-erythritol 2,4-cyclodiphosphate synthase